MPGSLQPLPETNAMCRARFEAEVVAAGKPVVIREQAATWRAVAAATQGDAALVAALKPILRADHVGIVRSPSEAKGRLFYDESLTAMNFERGSAAPGDVLDRLLAMGEGEGTLAIQSTALDQLFNGFEAANPMPLVDAAVVGRAWIGNRVDVVPHYDLSDNIGVVVAGRRRFTLYPPEALAALYPGPFQPTPAGTQVSMVDPDAPDLERYPRYPEAAAMARQAVLAPGDAIYIPYHWWHRVESLDPFNMFVNYWWNPAPADGAADPYEAFLMALAALRPLDPRRREAWRTRFDHYVFEADGDPAAHLPPPAQWLIGPPTPTRLANIRAAIQTLVGRWPG